MVASGEKLRVKVRVRAKVAAAIVERTAAFIAVERYGFRVHGFLRRARVPKALSTLIFVCFSYIRGHLCRR
jgi:hypothetical protein